MDLYRYTHGYRALRALIEDLLLAPPDAQRRNLEVALHEWLRQHCRECGELIDRAPRQQGDAFCYACTTPAPPRRAAPPNDNDVPF